MQLKEGFKELGCTTNYDPVITEQESPQSSHQANDPEIGAARAGLELEPVFRECAWLVQSGPSSTTRKTLELIGVKAAPEIRKPRRPKFEERIYSSDGSGFSHLG